MAAFTAKERGMGYAASHAGEPTSSADLKAVLGTKGYVMPDNYLGTPTDPTKVKDGEMYVTIQKVWLKKCIDKDKFEKAVNDQLIKDLATYGKGTSGMTYNAVGFNCFRYARGIINDAIETAKGGPYTGPLTGLHLAASAYGMYDGLGDIMGVDATLWKTSPPPGTEIVQPTTQPAIPQPAGR